MLSSFTKKIIISFSLLCASWIGGTPRRALIHTIYRRKQIIRITLPWTGLPGVGKLTSAVGTILRSIAYGGQDFLVCELLWQKIYHNLPLCSTPGNLKEAAREKPPQALSVEQPGCHAFQVQK